MSPPEVETSRAGTGERTLAAFRPLLHAEEILVAGLDEGRFDRIDGGGPPEPGDPRRVIRAELLRLLILGAPDAPRVHEKGVRISGAIVQGALDLEGCRIPGDLGLVDCLFEQPLVLRSASISTLFLDGSRLPGFVAERLETRGDLLMRTTVCDGPVVLPGARLGGGLVADGATLERAGDKALDAENLEARGDILLRGATVRGGVVLAGARIGGEIDATGARFEHAEGVAFDLGSAMVEGGVVLRHVAADGELRLSAFRCEAGVDLSGATISAPGETALTLADASLRGALTLRADARIDGLLDLRGCMLGSMRDDPACWPAPGDLALDRCRYAAFLGAPADAETRLEWLSRQTPERWGEDFWPQPFEHLAKVLQEMGHDEEALRILFEKEHLQRRARRRRARSALLRAVLWLRDAFLRVTVGYGRRSLLALVWLVVFWIAGAGALSYAWHVDAMRPNMPFIVRLPEWIQCAVPVGDEVGAPSFDRARPGLAEPGESQLACYLRQPEAAAYPAFNPWMYAVDTLVPAVDTGQRGFWAPDTRVPTGVAAKVVSYVLTLSGWVLGLLAVAGFAGLVRSR